MNTAITTPILSIAVVFAFTVSTDLSAASSSSTSFECLFDKHYATYLDEDKTEKYQKGVTFLNIISGQTSKLTLALDGSERATNSSTWELVSANGLGGRYIGDDGDLLSIMYQPDDTYGDFISTLQWATRLGYAFTSVGSCTGSP